MTPFDLFLNILAVGAAIAVVAVIWGVTAFALLALRGVLEK